MYGPAQETPVNLVKKLTEQDLKSTFRRKAMLCHPDRANINSMSPAELDAKFKEINWAYQTLKEAMAPGATFTSSSSYASPKSQPAATQVYQQPFCNNVNNNAYSGGFQNQTVADDHYWCGAIPRQKLPFGQYLYYSGRISWNTLVQALDWQETQRPKFGQIALEGQLLTPGALSRLLSHRYRGEKIGDAAMRLGYLSPRMKDAVLNIQKHRQPAIGQFFISNGLLGQEELGKWLVSQRQHNAMVN